MTKQRIFSSRQLKKQSQRHRTGWRFNRNRIAVWISLTLVALFSVIFLIALMQQDTDLMEKALSALIFAMKLALQQAFSGESKK
ncbi:MAG: hypothetical protein HYR94_14410 [Chloroflexi bacterium]|nr:hypothetical protein [Chloroflexota bacterium]